MSIVAHFLSPLKAAKRAPMRRGHLGYIDGARAVAALYVVLHHCFQWTWTGYLATTTEWWYVGWLSYGHYAVSAFIAISGFSLMLPVARADGHLIGGAWAFFKRRARRIIPPYYFAIGFALLLDWLFVGKLAGTAWDVTLPITLRTVVTHLLLIHNLDGPGNFTINGVFWSIGIEWQIYFIFPLLVLASRRLSSPVAVVCMFALCALAYVGLSQTAGRGFPLLPAYWSSKLDYLHVRLAQLADYACLFALGTLAAVIAYSPRLVWQKVRSHVPWGWMSLAWIAALTALLMLHGRQLGSWWGAAVDLLAALVTLTLFIGAATSGRSIAARVLGWQPLTFVGSYAYSVYLIHAPIIAVLFQYLVYPHLIVALHLPRIVSTAVLISVAFPVVVVVSYGFFLICERPFLNKPAASKPALAAARTDESTAPLEERTSVARTYAVAPHLAARESSETT